jgi:hypothetical protein
MPMQLGASVTESVVGPCAVGHAGQASRHDVGQRCLAPVSSSGSRNVFDADSSSLIGLESAEHLVA